MDIVPAYLIALEPEEGFARWVGEYKDQVRGLVGQQLYLDHPPHLTLYTAVFPSGVDLLGPVAVVADGLLAPRVVMSQWHVFQSDQLTGRHTLVCDVPAESQDPLRQIQRQVVEAIAPLRDQAACLRRYEEAWERLSSQEQESVRQFGFPFVGPGWRPHVTIASIRPDDWPRVEPLLAERPPGMTVRFGHLSTYLLDDAYPVLVERFALRG